MNTKLCCNATLFEVSWTVLPWPAETGLEWLVFNFTNVSLACYWKILDGLVASQFMLGCPLCLCSTPASGKVKTCPNMTLVGCWPGLHPALWQWLQPATRICPNVRMPSFEVVFQVTLSVSCPLISKLLPTWGLPLFILRQDTINSQCLSWTHGLNRSTLQLVYVGWSLSNFSVTVSSRYSGFLPQPSG